MPLPSQQRICCDPRVPFRGAQRKQSFNTSTINYSYNDIAVNCANKLPHHSFRHSHRDRQTNKQRATHTRAPSQASLRRSKRYYHAVRSRGGSTTSALINFCDVFQSLNKSFVGRRVIETRTPPRGADQPGAEANRTPGTNGGMQGRAGVLSRPAPLRRWSIGETQDNANQL